jgi:hypothetical protein
MKSKRAFENDEECYMAKFKAPGGLKLTGAQHAALVELLGAMERGELHHARLRSRASGSVDYVGGGPDGFSMIHWDCGTAACLGGWAERIGGPDLFFDTTSPALSELFYPTPDEGVPIHNLYNTITVPQAAAALRNYLTTGAAQWDDVLAKEAAS